MNRYFYKCNQCESEYSARQIEDGLIYLCPACGSAEKNKPLHGVLNIEYNYEKIKKEITRDEFLKIQPGKFFKYPFLYPLEYSKTNGEYFFPKISYEDLNRLSLPSNSLIKRDFENKKIYFLDETRNPTYSFKDRASMLVALKAKQTGITQISAASTGNAGSSIAGICSMLGMRSKIFVPKNIPEAKRIQIQSYGADIHVVDGDYDSAFDLCLDLSNEKKWYNRNTAYNPLTIEGKKSAAFDIFIQTNGQIPDLIFIPAGDGVIIGGIYKGFVELQKLGWIKKLPKLVAVQAEGSRAIVDFVSTGKFEYKSASTIADSISAGAPRNLFMAADAVKQSNGFAVAVSDDDILKAQEILAKSFGFLVEPSSAAAFAGYLVFKNSFANHEIPLVLLTGSGLKDSQSLKIWNDQPAIKSAVEWKSIFKTKD